MDKDIITFEEFLEIESKLEIKIGQIIGVKKIPKSKDLIILTVMFGNSADDIKTVVTNLGKYFDSNSFIDVIVPFITNLKPMTIMGVESQAMVMVGTLLAGGLELKMTQYSLGTKLL